MKLLRVDAYRDGSHVEPRAWFGRDDRPNWEVGVTRVPPESGHHLLVMERRGTALLDDGNPIYVPPESDLNVAIEAAFDRIA